MPSRSVQPAGVPANAGGGVRIAKAHAINSAVTTPNCSRILLPRISSRSSPTFCTTFIISRPWQPEPCDSACCTVASRLQIECAAMKLCDPAHQQQANSAAVWLGGKKRHEQVFRIGRSRTVVEHFD